MLVKNLLGKNRATIHFYMHLLSFLWVHMTNVRLKNISLTNVGLTNVRLTNVTLTKGQPDICPTQANVCQDKCTKTSALLAKQRGGASLYWSSQGNWAISHGYMKLVSNSSNIKFIKVIYFISKKVFKKNKNNTVLNININVF